MTPPSPAEAADGLEWLTGPETDSVLGTAAREVLRVLVDHARASAPTGPGQGGDVVAGMLDAAIERWLSGVAALDWAQTSALRTRLAEIAYTARHGAAAPSVPGEAAETEDGDDACRAVYVEQRCERPRGHDGDHGPGDEPCDYCDDWRSQHTAGQWSSCELELRLHRGRLDATTPAAPSPAPAEPERGTEGGDERIRERDLSTLRDAGTIVFCDVVNRHIPGVISTWSYGAGPRHDQTCVSVEVDEDIYINILAKNVYLPAPPPGRPAETGETEDGRDLAALRAWLSDLDVENPDGVPSAALTDIETVLSERDRGVAIARRVPGLVDDRDAAFARGFAAAQETGHASFAPEHIELRDMCRRLATVVEAPRPLAVSDVLPRVLAALASRDGTAEDEDVRALLAERGDRTGEPPTGPLRQAVERALDIENEAGIRSGYDHAARIASRRPVPADTEVAISRDESGRRTVWLRTVVGESGLKHHPEIKPGETTWHQLQGTGEHVRELPPEARPAPVSGAAVPDGGADPDATRIARKVLAEDETVELVARKYHRLVDPMVPSLSEKDDETREAYRAEARKALRAALDVPGAPSPLAEVAGLLGCTPDQVPARVRGLLDEQRGGEA